MPNTIRPLKVFLCYTHADRLPVKELYDLLTHDGVEVWMDKENLLGGKNWGIEIRKAVRDCDIFIACISADFTKKYSLKKFNQTEVGIALNEAQVRPNDKIFIVPVRMEECDVPKKLSKLHWIDLFESDGYKQLIRSLNQRIEQLEPENSISNISIQIGGNIKGNIIVGDRNTIETKTLTGLTLQQEQVSETNSINIKKDRADAIAPLKGAGIAFICTLILFFGTLLVAHLIVGTPFVPNLAALFRIAPGGDAFYYPDLNALLFDILLHPSVFAILIFLKLFKDKHMQGSKSLQEGKWKKAGLVIMPIVLGVYAIFSVYETRYQFYNLAQPLLAVALGATGISFAGFTALAGYSFFTAWGLTQATSVENLDSEPKNSIRVLLAVLAVTVLLLGFEAIVVWWTSVYKGAPGNDFQWVATTVISILTIIGLSAGIFITGRNLLNLPR